MLDTDWCSAVTSHQQISTNVMPTRRGELKTERKCLNNAVQFFVRPTLNAWHDLKDEAMFKVLSLTVCLLAGTFQTTFGQRSHPDEPKSTATAVKYSAYGTAIPIVVGGAIVLAVHSDGEDSGDNVTAFVIGIHVGSLGAVAGSGLEPLSPG